MNAKELFRLALNIDDTWVIRDIKYNSNDGNSGRIDIYVDYRDRNSEYHNFNQDSRPAKPEKTIKSWLFANLFHNECYIHASIPVDFDIKTNNMKNPYPWTKDRSMTLLFEAFAMLMLEREMPVRELANDFGVNIMSISGMMNFWSSKRVVNPYNTEACTEDEICYEPGYRHKIMTKDNSRLTAVSY